MQRRSAKADATTTSAAPVPFDALEFPSCYRPWQACSISELGDVRPCAIYWRPMGSIRNHRFEEGWNGRKYRRLRRHVNTSPDSICHTCRLPNFDHDRANGLPYRAAATAGARGRFSARVRFGSTSVLGRASCLSLAGTSCRRN
ncbi:MAG: SPASM domain-containing protein [Vicinamibacterales bacterium]